MTSRRLSEAVGAISLAFGCGAVSAQPCEEQWLESHGVAGPNGTVYAMTVWDDGRGPALYVGGSFTHMGDQSVSGIAKWDGMEWSVLGEGLSDYVHAFAVFQGQLVAGGRFSASGQKALNGIALWNGSTWQSLGEGVTDGPGWTAVYSLAEYEDQLIVGGRFESAGGAPALNIARWNGQQWHAMGSGIEMVGIGDNPEVRALLAHHGDLLAGGRFDTAGGVTSESIARWNGREWLAMGSKSIGAVNDLAAFQGQLIAGAQLGLFAWNDAAWTQYAGGVDDCTSCYFASVFALANLDKQLMVGGNFATAGGEIVNHIGAWDGKSWSAIGGGVGECTSWACSVSVSQIAEFQGDVYVGGNFVRAGNKGANHLARWDGTAWHACAPGTNSNVRAFVQFDGDLIAAGDFLSVEGVQAQRVARWDGTAWTALGDGLGGCVAIPPYECQPIVRALAVYQDEIIAGGRFTQSGPQSVHNIARWDGRQWLDLASGVNGAVHALAAYRDDLIAGGDFAMAGGVAVNRIARWDGRQWHTMGSGTNGPVFALQVFDDELVAVGDFSVAGGVSAHNIARWNGVEWSAMGGTTYYVYALGQHQGTLFAGVSYYPYLLHWIGDHWSIPAGGLLSGSFYSYPLYFHAVETFVRAVASHNGRLFVGGHFEQAGPVDASFIAAWDDGNWSALGDGTNHFVYALASFDGQLFVGGGFTEAGGNVAAYLARWGCTEKSFAPADLNHDGVVDGYDLAMLLASWSIPPGSAGCGQASPCAADLSGDGAVDAADVSILLAAWGPHERASQ